MPVYATLYGPCCACGDLIRPGQSIRSVPSTLDDHGCWQHADCDHPDTAFPRETRSPHDVCPLCFLQRPCEHDDLDTQPAP